MAKNGALFDYVIVGGGSAGCVLANRLTEDSDVSVAILECGGRNRSPLLQMPAAVADVFMQKSGANWMFLSAPQDALGGRRLGQPRGRGWGGSSAINGMIYVRGNPKDYDEWRQVGLAGWSYADVLPYFKKAEHNEGGCDLWRGEGGPLWVSLGPSGNPLYKAFINAGRQAGYPVTKDFNGYQQEGMGPFHHTIRDGRRWSAAHAYLEPALSRSNLTIIPHARALKIDVEDGVATGVRYASREGGRVRQIRARREVIVAAGAFQTPQLLMLSGIGPAEELMRHNIPIVHESNEVGRNLQDHFDVTLSFECTKGITAHTFTRGHRKILLGMQYMLLKQGQGCSNHVQAGAFLKTREELDRPDIQLHFVNAIVVDQQMVKAAGDGFTVHICQLRPESRGEVRLASSNPFAAPVIDPRYLTSHLDRHTLREGVRVVREIVKQDALKFYRGAELNPGPDIDSDAQIDEWVSKTGQSIFHPVGTVRMGVDENAPVDADLKLRGVEHLRIVDASVMPALVGGNTNAAVIMIAEKAADLIRGRPALPRLEVPIAEDVMATPL